MRRKIQRSMILVIAATLLVSMALLTFVVYRQNVGLMEEEARQEAGYICAMLFIILGFPFITSEIDLAKLDMRSGTERLMYALIVILVATMAAWLMALILHL